MTALRRKKDGARHTGFMYKGPLQDLPMWMNPVVEAGLIKPVTATSPMEVKIITGKFWPVFANDWIIVSPTMDCYLIADEDLGNVYEIEGVEK